MGHENPRISSGQKERDIGLTSCDDEWEVRDDNPPSAEKHLVWHWGKMTHNPSKTIVNFLSSVFGLVFIYFLSSFSTSNLWRWKWRNNGGGDREREMQV